MNMFKMARMLAVSALIGAAGCASSSPPVQQPPLRAPTMASRPRDVRVMTFNLRCPTIFDGFNYWPLRKETLVRTIRSFDPDVLGTQECVAAQADYLQEQLPDYEFVGVGRN